MTHPLIAALTDAAGSRALAEVLADFLLAQPMGRLIRAERVLDQLDRVLDERLMERATGAHLRPAIDREIARAKARGDVVGDWLTAEAKAELRSLAGRPIRIDRRMVERVVKQDEVKELIRQVVKDTLERFLTTVKTGGDDGGGAVGSLGRKAFGFANRASAGVLGSLGSALEGRLTSAMNTFVAHNLDGVLDKVVAVITSPETARQVSRGAMKTFDRAMDFPGRRVAEEAEKLPWDDLLEAVPGLIAHNLGREALRAGIRAEVDAALAVEGERPVRSLWADEAAVAAARADIVEVLTPLVADFGASEAYGAWLADHAPMPAPRGGKKKA